MTDGFRRTLLIISGLIIGLTNGFLGGGGGVLCVVVLLCVLRFATKEAHATALFVILPVTLLSAVIYIIGGNADLKVTLLSALGVTLGGIVGASLLRKLKAPSVELIFAMILIFAGIGML